MKKKILILNSSNIMDKKFISKFDNNKDVLVIKNPLDVDKFSQNFNFLITDTKISEDIVNIPTAYFIEDESNLEFFDLKKSQIISNKLNKIQIESIIDDLSIQNNFMLKKRFFRFEQQWQVTIYNEKLSSYYQTSTSNISQLGAFVSFWAFDKSALIKNSWDFSIKIPNDEGTEFCGKLKFQWLQKSAKESSPECGAGLLFLNAESKNIPHFLNQLWQKKPT